MLGAFLGVALLAAAWLEIFVDAGNLPTTFGILALVMGLAAAAFGTLVWLGSIIMD